MESLYIVLLTGSYVLIAFISASITHSICAKSKPRSDVQKVAHRLPTPDIDVVRENKRLSCFIPRLEKERDYYKRQAAHWMPKFNNTLQDVDITVWEALDWLENVDLNEEFEGTFSAK